MIKPLFDRVVLLPEEKKEQTKSGIFLPEMASVKPKQAVVIAVGEGETFEGDSTQMKVNVGDVVLFSTFGGVEYEFEGKKYMIVRQGDILAKVEE